MLTFAQRTQPGTRRILDAMRSMDSEIQERPGCGAVDLSAWKASLIRGHRRVRDLYREVLATHDMPQAERASIHDRIARIEAELASLRPTHENDSSNQNAA
jgi:hypothetical protein